MDLPPGTWFALTGAVLTSSVLSALITSGIQWYREHRKLAKEEKSFALVEGAKFVGVLEQYSLSIALQVISNVERGAQLDEELAIKVQDTDLPDPPEIPHGLLIKYLPPAIAADIIWIDTETNLSRMHMRSVWDLAFFASEGVGQLHELLGFLGWKAIDVADRLRDELGLPQMQNPLFDDYRSLLHQLNQAYSKRIQKDIDSRTAQG